MTNDCKQLLYSLKSAKNGEAFQININIPVTGNAYFQCVEINGDIVGLGQDSIAFGGDRLIYPHVTLKMGDVLNGDIETVLKSLADYTRNLSRFTLAPQPVILKPTANKYYFAEIADERLLNMSSELDKLFEGKIQAHRFALSESNLHHITLGYKYAEQPTADVLGRQVDEFTVDRIAVSVAGKFGVCLGTLATFPLK